MIGSGLNLANSIADSISASTEASISLTSLAFNTEFSIRLRTHNQNRTVAARAIADMKTFGHLS